MNNKAIKFAKDCSEHYGPIIPQGVSFTKFEDHLNDVDNPWSWVTLFNHQIK